MFPLFQSHLDLAHQYWKRLIRSGDIVIDATCGNGQDTLVMAKLSLTENSGTLYALDIHPRAISLTRELLQSHLSPGLIERLHLCQQCHSTFPDEIKTGTVSLITYNLGYLPGGGDKSQTTLVKSTLQSLINALTLLKEGGLISMTCYPGHEEGQKEENEILAFTATLDPKQWNCCHHRWLNRKRAPSLLLIQKLYHR
jgi:SAM-dependent methyltransferase